MLKDRALELFKNGYSCSESIVQACIENGLCPADMLPCATTFSAGMSSGCVCGTIAASQMVLGYIFGRNNKFGNQTSAREKAAEFVEEFKNKHKVTCCRVLSAGFEGSAKKEHCKKFVAEACDILEELIKVRV
ncbi:MAG: C-GCAxxG-C-C family protein [Muribaculaceae bacterium]|nr:C-GCAxxG-C-C family protein [Muribaculaceae bacterium]